MFGDPSLPRRVRELESEIKRLNDLISKMNFLPPLSKHEIPGFGFAVTTDEALEVADITGNPTLSQVYRIQTDGMIVSEPSPGVAQLQIPEQIPTVRLPPEICATFVPV